MIQNNYHKKNVAIDLDEIIPQKKAVLRSQGVPEGVSVEERIKKLLSQAMQIFADVAQPEGIISDISVNDFAKIFKGEGKNAPSNPLKNIFPHADRLALFALTMGSEISIKIQQCFNKDDFALGSMLDSVASLAAENAIEIYEEHFVKNNTIPENHVLSYSPGYCGWDISGQKKIFDYLRPEKIGITLNESYLMTPIKSVTGVLIDGKKKIHIFKPNFSFCDDCRHRSCIERMKKIRKK